MTDDADEAASPAPGQPGDVPDVTVVVPVYNTMPYLTACLDSLVAQSIGRERMHVVAVDDGSTDGGGEELDRFTKEHVGLFTVLHQENSGGPAGPCNRGLDLAEGRYVFFLGADDYLADRALEKLVAAADAWDSDIIWGRVEGVGGRLVSQRLFGSSEKTIPFPHSELPYTLSNSKMFRRSMLEEHHTRYPLDLRVGSDQPFTVEAMLHARRISVLADETYYYGVRRENSANISFSTTSRDRLGDIGVVMDHIAGLVPPGPDRDAIFKRHFAWEVANRFRADFLDLDAGEQEKVCAAAAALADRYLTDEISRGLTMRRRLRVRLAQAGLVEELVRLVRAEEAGETPALALRGDEVFLAHPGYDAGLPPEHFAVKRRRVRTLAPDAVRVSSLQWQGRDLVVAADVRLHPTSAAQVRAVLVPVRRSQGIRPVRRFRRGRAVRDGHSWPVLLEARPEADSSGGSRLTARVDVTPLLESRRGRHAMWALRFHFDAHDRTYDVPAEGGTESQTRVRQGLAFYRIFARPARNGAILLTRHRIPFVEVARAPLRRLARH
ncbi:MAG: glycosyltransferase family 2 protein [Nocardioidaceae bacterium]